MHSRTTSRVTEWDSRPFGPDGDDLPTLVEMEFSGAISVADAWLFMLNGRGIGIFGGSVADFVGAEGTVYESPDPALPLLFTMWESDGDRRAEYYTEKTAIAEVDETLQSSSFTGYVELSENVISGDYYVVYYGGRAMSVAFVGASGRLVTGEEAFEKANDEVGIFEVTAVDIAVLDLPDPAGTSGAAGGSHSDSAPTTGPDRDSDPGNSPAPDSDPGTGPDPEPDHEPTPTPESRAGNHSDQQTDSTSDEDRASDEMGSAGSETASAGGPSPSEPPADPADVDGAGAPSDRQNRSSAAESAESASPPMGPEHAGEEPAPDPGRQADERPSAESAQSVAGDRTAADPFTAEAEWRERTEIPSLDPDRTTLADADADAETEAGGTSDAHSEPVTPDATGASRESPSHRQRADPPTDESAAPADSSGGSGEAAGPMQQSDTANATDAGADPDALEQERERRQAAEERVAELESRIAELERALESTAESSAHPSATETMDPATALEKSNLFVRYRSPGEPTLESAIDADADPEAVNDNLQIESHTNFERDGVHVGQQPFDDFLLETIEYRFTSWIVQEFPYDVRRTGQIGGLKDLYNAIPNIDRADLRGTMSIQYEEDGEEHREQETFDVILRDRMGRPLIVASINDSTEPATRNQMAELVGAAERAKETVDSLVGAFFVTTSFFERGALETADAATGSGFLRSSSRLSYVKLSRKRGFHLCLVEAREGDFHLSVPEL